MDIHNVVGKSLPLNRKKTDPSKFIFTGNALQQGFDMQLFKYKPNECIEAKSITPDSIDRFTGNHYSYWLNIHGLNNPEAVVTICKRQDIDDLIIQDILDVNQRPKFQEFDGFAFLTIKSMVPSDTNLIAEQISFVFGDKFLISFQERKADYFEHLRFRLREDKGIIRSKGSDYLLYTMLESILDNYFKTLNQLDTEIEQLNLTDISKDISPDVLVRIEAQKKVVHMVKKSILPIKEFALAVERDGSRYISPSHLKYFLEVKDLCLTLLDTCDLLQATLESSTNLFFSVQGHRMNLVMKTLTIVATIFIPLTFVAGIYGMNFHYMPELTWRYGYFAIWGLIAIIFIGMIIFFRRRRWL
ncbi:MAG TPA: magnesium/cobalt transporter CorA [Tenuifilaceae bacterium]|nr:magnesium/cobalt transporter CorA [Tenuifilaceae bacterium]HQB78357.1 magnesium/cobalt transporter CorA [Tenuifilaceae bacterium]